MSKLWKILGACGAAAVAIATITPLAIIAHNFSYIRLTHPFVGNTNINNNNAVFTKESKWIKGDESKSATGQQATVINNNVQGNWSASVYQPTQTTLPTVVSFVDPIQHIKVNSINSTEKCYFFLLTRQHYLADDTADGDPSYNLVWFDFMIAADSNNKPDPELAPAPYYSWHYDLQHTGKFVSGFNTAW